MSILVATPMYGGSCTEGYFASCLKLKSEFMRVGMKHDWFTLTNESLITRGRNVCAASFLKETDFECLLFIDADIEFEPADVAHLWNLCDLGADVAVGAYRKKKPDATLSAWVDGEQIYDLENRREPFAVDYAGTGFMMIKRATLERLKRPEIEHEEGHVGQCWAFFDTCVIDGFYCSEDYWFCRMVRQNEMRVMLDPKIKLKHHGQAVY